MSSYIGKVSINSEEYAIGSTLYGSCDTSASTAAKQISLPAFTTFLPGITIYVKFINGNTAESGVTLQMNPTTNPSATQDSVVGLCTCEANEILAFTYENANPPVWRTHTCGGVVTQTSLQSTLNSALANLGPLKFKGVLQSVPADNTTAYENGDVVVVGSKEYVFIVPQGGTSHWEPFGDDMTQYALESNTASVSVLNALPNATVTNGVLILPVVSATSVNVITPRANT